MPIAPHSPPPCWQTPPSPGAPALLLDRTCFYPAAGGQPPRHRPPGRRTRGRGDCRRRQRTPRAGGPGRHRRRRDGERRHRLAAALRSHAAAHRPASALAGLHPALRLRDRRRPYRRGRCHPRPGCRCQQRGGGCRRSGSESPGLHCAPGQDLFRRRRGDCDFARAPPAKGQRAGAHRRDRRLRLFSLRRHPPAHHRRSRATQDCASGTASRPNAHHLQVWAARPGATMWKSTPH
jgi:hypothetical protein